MNTSQKNKKFLMVATVPSMIGEFNMDNIRILQEMGYEVHVACNFKDYSVWTRERIEKFRGDLVNLKVKEIQVEFARTPYDISKLLQAYKKIRKLIRGQKYEGLHCHTPVAGMVTRLAATHTKTKVIYTAHGFHFFKGAPLKNWLIYYPVEKICSYMTDVLITINKEDYALAKKKMAAKRVEYVPGVGIDLKKFCLTEGVGTSKREELKVADNEIMLLSVGELNANKNHEIVIKALSKIDNSNISYYIAGEGELKEKLNKLAKKSNVKLHLLGYRKDVPELLQASDIFVLPSLREGLNVSLMEAIASKRPVICSKIRGNMDLVSNSQDMFKSVNVKSVLCVLKDKLIFKNQLLERKEIYKKMSRHVENNYRKLQTYDLKEVRKRMLLIYEDVSNKFERK